MAPNNVPDIARDEEGYLVDPEEWNEAVASRLAEEAGVQLTSDHWHVIAFMRKHYDEHRVAVDARFVIKYLSDTKGAGRNYLFELFPYGYVQQACKIAGMKRPRAWSVG